VEIPILFDPAVESTEHADLASPGGGATLGTQDYSDLYIFDSDPTSPAITVEDGFVEEGDSGETEMTFLVRLSPTDHQLTLHYWQYDGTATAGEDFQYVDEEFVFPVSPLAAQTQLVSVQIFGDTDVEENEHFAVRVGTTPGGGYALANDTYGYGEIRNDDDNGVDPPAFRNHLR